MIKVAKSSPKTGTRGSQTAKKPDKIRPSITKLSQLEALLRRAEGATIEQLVSALNWQAHSVRGAISGSLKKKRGLMIVDKKAEGEERVYRIAE